VSSSLESIIVGQDEAVQFLPRCLVPLMKSKMKPAFVLKMKIKFSNSSGFQFIYQVEQFKG